MVKIWRVIWPRESRLNRYQSLGRASFYPIKQHFRRRMSRSAVLLVSVVVQFHQGFFIKHMLQHGQICLFCHSYCIARIRFFIEVGPKNFRCRHPHPNSYFFLEWRGLSKLNSGPELDQMRSFCQLGTPSR